MTVEFGAIRPNVVLLLFRRAPRRCRAISAFYHHLNFFVFLSVIRALKWAGVVFGVTFRTRLCRLSTWLGRARSPIVCAIVERRNHERLYNRCAGVRNHLPPSWTFVLSRTSETLFSLAVPFCPRFPSSEGFT